MLFASAANLPALRAEAVLRRDADGDRVHAGARVGLVLNGDAAFADACSVGDDDARDSAAADRPGTRTRLPSCPARMSRSDTTSLRRNRLPARDAGVAGGTVMRSDAVA